MDNISLTSIENDIFNILLSVNDKYSLGVTFRVAGGWVRDKLLGKESDDIDISLDVMTGKQFCKFLKKKMSINIHIIKENHAQSKHLEVASVTMFGTNIDFLHLRTEEYNNSRIPQICIGTPEEDALRRDLTINSLFYNINTCAIEDYTGKGLDDLRNKIIRTPLDTISTFTDDPLRILRAIRFCVMPDFNIDNNIISTVRDSSYIRSLIKKKVSYERLMIEIRKIISINAVMGIHIMNQMNIVSDLLNIDMDENLIKIIDNYGEKNGKIMDIVTFVSLIYYDKNYKKLFDMMKLTNKEKKEATCVIISLLRYIDLSESDDISIAKLGRIVFDTGKGTLLDISMNILRAILNESKFNQYNTCINDLRWILEMKPIVNGHDIMKLFDVKGDSVKTLLNRVIDIQIMHKNYTKEQIIEMLTSEYSDLIAEKT